MFYQSEGIVLDQADLGENDKIATIFTKEGLRAVVKGAQRPKIASGVYPAPNPRLFQLISRSPNGLPGCQ